MRVLSGRNAQPMAGRKPKCLIAYFSRKGDNYVSGKIVNLPVGNTEVVGKAIRELTSGDLFRIEPVKPYPADYTRTTEVAKKELHENARPELVGQVANLEPYDVIFLGYPNWWGTMPMAVFTFLERHDFSGKTIAPFCTHEGSGLGRSEGDITRLCPAAAIAEGLAIHGTRVDAAKTDIETWLDRIGFSQNVNGQ
jgi:flavodoxin